MATGSHRDPSSGPPERKQQAMEYRQAAASDVVAIARLHADSWRRHYRGAYLDS
jgi:ribosomal protein S18 acetylase RimI-like enzyme